MLHLCFSAGLRVSELVGLPLTAVDAPGITEHSCQRKRATRALPTPVETNRYRSSGVVGGARRRIGAGAVSQRSWPTHDALRLRVPPAQACPYRHLSVVHRFNGYKRVSPHVLRHTCAMMILQATGDLRRVSLWLGHADMQTTEVYLRADPTDKLEVIEAITPPALKRGRFRAPDKLIASLQRS